MIQNKQICSFLAFSISKIIKKAFNLFPFPFQRIWIMYVSLPTAQQSKFEGCKKHSVVSYHLYVNHLVFGGGGAFVVISVKTKTNEEGGIFAESIWFSGPLLQGASCVSINASWLAPPASTSKTDEQCHLHFEHKINQNPGKVFLKIMLPPNFERLNHWIKVVGCCLWSPFCPLKTLGFHTVRLSTVMWQRNAKQSHCWSV